MKTLLQMEMYYVIEYTPTCRVKGPGGSMSQVVGLPINSYKPIINTAWVHDRLCKLQKGCTRIASASDKVYQLLGSVVLSGYYCFSITKTGLHDTAEILLKVALKHQIYNQSTHSSLISILYIFCLSSNHQLVDS